MGEIAFVQICQSDQLIAVDWLIDFRLWRDFHIYQNLCGFLVTS